MRVLVTGADGFIGSNLCVAFAERSEFEVLPVTRETNAGELTELVSRADAVVHLAGVNRPVDVAEFETGNVEFTDTLCTALTSTKRQIPVAFASSIRATGEDAYGRTKRTAEQRLGDYSSESGAAVAIFRLPNVFGKWSRPNYNSVVATFCHNVARGLPITINDPAAIVRLSYIDDVVRAFLDFLTFKPTGLTHRDVAPVYETTVGQLAEQINRFQQMRSELTVGGVGSGLERALYATYVSFLPAESFAYPVPRHDDDRGTFVEILKTFESGQFSFFTARPGITRGGHYHHTKTEKFLVVSGRARFRFRNVRTNESHEIETSAAEPVIVDTIPGWAHDITNIGKDEMIVLLWANEIFDRARPDTVASKV